MKFSYWRAKQGSLLLTSTKIQELGPTTVGTVMQKYRVENVN